LASTELAFTSELLIRTGWPPFAVAPSWAEPPLGSPGPDPPPFASAVAVPVECLASSARRPHWIYHFTIICDICSSQSGNSHWTG
jgi:hypothetical protein